MEGKAGAVRRGVKKGENRVPKDLFASCRGVIRKKPDWMPDPDKLQALDEIRRSEAAKQTGIKISRSRYAEGR